MTTTATSAPGARLVATKSKHEVAVDRLAKRPVDQADFGLPDLSNRAADNPDAAVSSSSAQPDQDALTVNQRVALCRSLEERAALEVSRVQRVSAAGSGSLDVYDVGIRSEVHIALTKMADGMYGDCETCQCPIPVARLRAVPYARRCLACQEREENGWHEVQLPVGGVARAHTGEHQGRSQAGL